MKKSAFWSAAVALAALVLVVAAWTSGRDSHASTDTWAVSADIAEACSCNVACPCLFGSPSTNEKCEGSRLIEIEKGHYKGVELDGLSVVVTFRMGGFSKYYISDEATAEQAKAAEQLVSAVFPPFVDWGLKGVETVPVTIERTGDRMKFGAPDATVEIELMKGLDGKAVTIHNLPAPFLTDYKQWISVENSHDADGVKFHYEKTNGFTSRLETGG